MKVLVFDTETTGLWKNKFASIKDNDNWPYIVQMAWVIFNMETKTQTSQSYIIKLRNNMKIPEDSIKIHGITDKDMENYGIDISIVLEKFLKDLKDATYLVAHNLAFDWKILSVEFYRNKLYKEINMNNHKKIKYCTMKYGKELYRFRSEKTGRVVKKYPKLIQLHSLLFNDKLNNNALHDALSDTVVCLRCFYKMLMDRDILKEAPSIKTLCSVFIS